MNKFMAALLAAAFSMGLATAAHADPYTFVVQEANTGGASFSAVSGALSADMTITATFSYNGPLDFSDTGSQNSSSSGDLNSSFFGSNANNISGYSGSGTLGGPANADFASLGSFLASSGSASGYQYGSLYTISLGDFAVGTTLTITHDGGVSLSGPGFSGTLTSGPTPAITEEVTITSAGPYTLYYANENGAPSVLDVTASAAVPEPASPALVGTGLAAVGLLRRKRNGRFVSEA